jgi:hypothetical protein
MADADVAVVEGDECRARGKASSATNSVEKLAEADRCGFRGDDVNVAGEPLSIRDVVIRENPNVARE